MLHSGYNRDVPATIEDNRTVLVVFKVEARADLPDEVSTILLQAGESIPLSEPITPWMRGVPRSSDETLSHLIIQNKRGAIFEIDEIRVGSSWQSVTQD